MKWILFTLFVAFAAPVLCLAATWKPARRGLFAALLASTAVKASVHFVSRADYRGPDRGFEVSLTDLIALSLAAGLVFARRRELRWLPFNTLPLAAFFLLAIGATCSAADPLLASFTLVKWAKAYLLYWTVYNLFRLEAPVSELWLGASLAAGIETVATLKQKCLDGVFRAHGTFDHSNTIPAYCLLLLPVLLAGLLQSERWRRASVIAVGAAALGFCGCVVAALSRAGAVLLGASVAAVMAWSWIRCRWTRRHWIVSAACALCLAAGTLKSYESLRQRFLHAPESSAAARSEFNRAALLMAGDRVGGVGLNCFSEVLTREARYREPIQVMRGEEQAGVCHHIYLLTAAEQGPLAAGLLVWVLARFWWRAARQIPGTPSPSRWIVLGCVVGLSALHVIGLLEWVLRLTPVLNVFWIVTGVSIALAERLEAADAFNGPSHPTSHPASHLTPTGRR